MKKRLLLILIASFGCSKNPAIHPQRPVFPTKDEVAIVDGVSFTLSDFLAIRSKMHQPSSETAYWIGVGSLAVRGEATKKGRKLSLLESTRLTEYAAGELSLSEVESDIRAFFPDQKQIPSRQEVKETIDRLIKQTWVQKGLIPISHL